MSWLLIGGLGIAGLVQMYPVADSRHYWWGLAVAMLALMSAFRSTRFRLLPVQNPFVISVVAALVVAIGVRPDVPLGRPRLRPGRFGPARNVVQRADRRLSDCGGPRPARAHDRTGREGRLPRAGGCMDRLRWSVPFHRPVLHRGREPQRPRETRRASTSSPTISTWLGAATRSTAADTSSSEAPNASRCSAGTSTSNDITSTDAGTTIRPPSPRGHSCSARLVLAKLPSRRWTPGTLQPRFLHGDQPRHLRRALRPRAGQQPLGSVERGLRIIDDSRRWRATTTCAPRSSSSSATSRTSSIPISADRTTSGTSRRRSTPGCRSDDYARLVEHVRQNNCIPMATPFDEARSICASSSASRSSRWRELRHQRLGADREDRDARRSRSSPRPAARR